MEKALKIIEEEINNLKSSHVLLNGSPSAKARLSKLKPVEKVLLSALKRKNLSALWVGIIYPCVGEGSKEFVMFSSYGEGVILQGERKGHKGSFDMEEYKPLIT